ncbi:hypothetical protein RM545_17050 [Zunongwangia sp. F260]|uniref:Lipoprotein n=1 Tax=Autumnicola lenta TaxID=3075593 RepID=A0ABU3CQ75_9FLAO|nr:hypothetical protein [Zunongwangia sp. F260]MDT0648402.1 hypothetical protein [Zunongwangia sp. F260]
MKKFYKHQFLLLFLSLTLLSCDNNEISCASDTSKILVKRILAENSDINQYVYYKADITQLELLDFYNEYSDLTQIRTSSIQDEINKCECQGTLKFQIPKNLLYKLENEKTNEFEIIYSIQQTEEGDVYAEAYLPTGLDNSVSTYLKIIKDEYRSFADKELKNMTAFHGNSDIYINALKDFLIADWNKMKNSKAYNGPEIGNIYWEENQLNIDDVFGNFLSVYDFNTLYITETKNSNIVISITNSGGGEGGNVGIEERYLLLKNGSSNFKILLAAQQII